MSDFRTSDEEAAFEQTFSAARSDFLSTQETAKNAWFAARDYFETSTGDAQSEDEPRSADRIRSIAAQWASSIYIGDAPFTELFNDALTFLQAHDGDGRAEQALFMAKWPISLAEEIYTCLTGGES